MTLLLLLAIVVVVAAVAVEVAGPVIPCNPTLAGSIATLGAGRLNSSLTGGSPLVVAVVALTVDVPPEEAEAAVASRDK